MKSLKEELQEKHQAELSVLKSELEKEMTKETTDLKNTLMEEKEKLKSLQTALENDESKKCLSIRLFCQLSFIHFYQILRFRNVILQNVFVLSSSHLTHFI